MFWSAGCTVLLKGQTVWLTDKYPGGQKLTDSDPENWLLDTVSVTFLLSGWFSWPCKSFLWSRVNLWEMNYTSDYLAWLFYTVPLESLMCMLKVRVPGGKWPVFVYWLQHFKHKRIHPHSFNTNMLCNDVIVIPRLRMFPVHHVK